ncbi:MAG TPA: hypothetical protein VF896_07825, partial [Anaerolineales bacterium]
SYLIKSSQAAREAPNGLRYAPAGYWWAGRGNAALTEPTSSHVNCLKTRTAKRPTSVAVAPWRHRVHAVLGRS